MPELFTVSTPHVALQKLFDHLSRLVVTETLSTATALNRVLIESPIATSALPAFARSAMDGYAVRAADTLGPASLAGLTFRLWVNADGPSAGVDRFDLHRRRSYTRAVCPSGADAVVMVERTQKLDAAQYRGVASRCAGRKRHQHGRGCERGRAAPGAGHILRPQDLGGLMALGITQVMVSARPRVAIVSTGDEVVPPEVAPGPGQVRDVNTYYRSHPGALAAFPCRRALSGMILMPCMRTREA